MSGFIVRGRDITLDLGRGWGLSLDPYIYRCIASPALNHNTPRAEYRWTGYTLQVQNSTKVKVYMCACVMSCQ